MKVLRKATLDEIEQVLLRLGGGNHADNMSVLGGLPNHFLVQLSEDEFLDLVFLQSKEVTEICRQGHDRRLAAVARRAVEVGNRKLSANWDLAEVERRTREALQTSATIEPLFLRDARKSEDKYGSWYLQDGSHRALGYAMALVAKRMHYRPIEAYCASTRLLW